MRESPRAGGASAAQAIAGDLPGTGEKPHTAPRAAASHNIDATSRAEHAGALGRLIAYLRDREVLYDIESHRGHHKMHKYAFIAKGLGMRLGYRFDFLENGAFSSGMEVDMCDPEMREALHGHSVAGNCVDPFGDARTSEAFLELVRGRGAEWLQAATFAVRDHGREGALDELVGWRGIIQYDVQTARGAFGAVEKCMGGIARAAP